MSRKNDTGTGWFKSSYSGATDDNCVECNFTPGGIGVRDSKRSSAEELHFSSAAWKGFLESLPGS